MRAFAHIVHVSAYLALGIVYWGDQHTVHAAAYLFAAGGSIIELIHYFRKGPA